MGPRYCEVCDGMLEDYRNLAWNCCQNMDCRACEKEICDRCADTNKPACRFCAQGDSCSTCWLVGPHILEEGFDHYQDHLAPRCTYEDCPVYLLLDRRDRCLSCWGDAATKLGCCIEVGHDAWTIKECGHVTCEAKQKQMECEEGECGVCKEQAEEDAADKKRKRESDLEESDVRIIQDCLSNVGSESAKAVLEEWIKTHSVKK